MMQAAEEMQSEFEQREAAWKQLQETVAQAQDSGASSYQQQDQHQEHQEHQEQNSSSMEF